MKTNNQIKNREFTLVNQVGSILTIDQQRYWIVSVFLIALSLIVFYSRISLADSPANISVPDSHSVEVKGKINLYRVQVQNMDLGKDGNKVHAEVFVTLDTDPKMVYALDINDNSPQSNRVMADALRDAYISNSQVTLYRQIAIKKTNNYKILMVQLNR